MNPSPSQPTPVHPTRNLKCEGQPKLPVAWLEVAADDSEGRVVYAGIRLPQVHVIERVEKAGLEAKLFALTEENSFARGNVPILITWSVNFSDAAVSEDEALRLREAARIEPLADGARIVLAGAHVIRALPAILG